MYNRVQSLQFRCFFVPEYKSYFSNLHSILALKNGIRAEVLKPILLARFRLPVKKQNLYILNTSVKETLLPDKQILILFLPPDAHRTQDLRALYLLLEEQVFL